MSLIGKRIGDFDAKAYHNGDFVDIKSEDIIGKWSVFVFYPADFTFVCPTELGELADLYDEFKKIECEVYSVSTDSHFAHKAWYDTSETIRKIRFPMISDSAHDISNDFRVFVPGLGIAMRSSFIVNPDGIIVSYEVNDLGIGRNSAELLRKVHAAQYVEKNKDRVCPASWIPGAETVGLTADLVGRI